MLFALAIATNRPVARATRRVNYVAENSIGRSGARELAYGVGRQGPFADSGARVIYVVCFSATAALIPSARSSRVSSLNRSI